MSYYKIIGIISLWIGIILAGYKYGLELSVSLFLISVGVTLIIEENIKNKN